jgi:LemA protein
MSPFIIVLIVAAVLLAFAVMIYNQLTRRRILVKEAWSGIGTFLQQRSDLIPNLVETVKGYALHESQTLADVIKWRNQAVSAKTPEDLAKADAGMNKALSGFFALAEQYPDLKANANFLSLQTDLKELETKLNQSRRYYNGTVRDYNQAIAVFPNNLLAGMYGFRPETFLEEPESAREVPKVSFR